MGWKPIWWISGIFSDFTELIGQRPRRLGIVQSVLSRRSRKSALQPGTYGSNGKFLQLECLFLFLFAHVAINFQYTYEKVWLLQQAEIQHSCRVSYEGHRGILQPSATVGNLFVRMRFSFASASLASIASSILCGFMGFFQRDLG